MPACYAHLRFGQQILPELPADIRKSAKRFSQLFAMGFHGPDLFFYYNPVFRTAIGQMGKTLHAQSGQTFFTAAAKTLHENPSEAGRVYLYGVLAHYALDSVAHPVINAACEDGKITHTEMEAEFDRYLLELDGKTPACEQDLSEYLRLTRGEWETVAAFYPPVSASAIGKCVAHMGAVYHSMATGNRKRLTRIYRLAGAEKNLIPERPNHSCTHLNGALMDCYARSVERYRGLVPQLTELLENGTPLGKDFLPDFSGGKE